MFVSVLVLQTVLYKLFLEKFLSLLQAAVESISCHDFEFGDVLSLYCLPGKGSFTSEERF